MTELSSLLIPTITHPMDAEIRVPGSKSLTNRALLAAALAEGESTLSGCLHSIDTEAMIQALDTLGVRIQCLQDDVITIHGNGGNFQRFDGTLNCVNAGTATRFLTATMSIVPGTQTIDGNERMRERPIQDLVDALRPLGVDIECKTGCPPVTVASSILHGGKTKIPGTISSQFLSALLLVTPYATQDTVIDIEGTVVSKPYIDLTLDVVHEFGGAITHSNYRWFNVRPVRYTGRTYAIEPDASSAGYWFALAAVTGGRMTVKGLTRRSRQADIQILDVLERMGCHVESTGDRVTVTGPDQLISPGTVDMVDFSDQVMTVAVLAALAEGVTTIANVEIVRRKETDRLAATAKELQKTGIRVEERPDSLVITGGIPHGAEIHTYNDHRMAMSFAVLGVKTPGIRIHDPGCVSKTYPRFFDDLMPIVQGK